ncbi:MAG: type II secretion system protein [Candidatus Pacebacteria bacterium]|nr:type II secretion system protein [Candidatus Paceibacterota bacterium]
MYHVTSHKEKSATPVLHATRYTNQGFTLIEMLVTTSIMILISGAVMGSIMLLYKGNRFAMEQALAVENARRGVEQMVRDVREASYSDGGAYPVVAIGSTTIAIYSDLDRDNDVELVRFYLEGTSFKKRVTNPTGTPAVYNEANGVVQTLSENVRNVEQNLPIFQFYNSAGTLLTSYGNVTPVSFVKISLIVNVNPETLPNEYILRSSATIRNLKVNL